MKNLLSLLSFLTITTLANGQTTPRFRSFSKADFPKSSFHKPQVWGKPKILHGKDSVARIKEETKSFRLVKKHYNAGKP